LPLARFIVTYFSLGNILGELMPRVAQASACSIVPLAGLRVFDGLSMYEHSCTVSLLRRLWNHHQEIVVSLLEHNGYTSVTGFSYGIRKYPPCRLKTICYSDGTSCHAADGDTSISYQARFTRYPQITPQSIYSARSFVRGKINLIDRSLMSRQGRLI
jgi:hypothetical protein